MMLILPVHEHSICFHVHGIYIPYMCSQYIYICLCLPWLFSSVLHSFLSTGPLPPWLGLFLGTLFFRIAITNGIFVPISVSAVSLFVYRNAFEF